MCGAAGRDGRAIVVVWQAVCDREVHKLQAHVEKLRQVRHVQSAGRATPSSWGAQSPRQHYLSKLDIARAPHALLSSRNNRAVISASRVVGAKKEIEPDDPELRRSGRASFAETDFDAFQERQRDRRYRDAGFDVEDGETPDFQRERGIRPTSFEASLEASAAGNTSHIEEYQSILSAALGNNSRAEPAIFGDGSAFDGQGEHNPWDHSRPKGGVGASTVPAGGLPSQHLPPQQTDPDQERAEPLSRQTGASSDSRSATASQSSNEEIVLEQMDDLPAAQSKEGRENKTDAEPTELGVLRSHLAALEEKFEAQQRGAAQMAEMNDQLRRKLIEVHEQNNENVGFAERQVRFSRLV